MVKLIVNGYKLKQRERCFNKRNGFSVAILLLVLVSLSISLIFAVPLITQMSENKTNVHENVIKCITDNDYTGWYNAGTGVTSLPSEGTACHAAILDSKYNRNGALSTSVWYASPEHGTASQQTMAKKIIRAACDQGGKKACDYFINACIKDGSSSVPYCDNTAGFEDLTYYLHFASATNNPGATYISSQLNNLLPQMKTKLLNEINYACNNNQAPDYSQNLNSNLACNLKGAKIYIAGCNFGYSAACAEAHDNNYNKSCSQIRAAWPDAPTDVYKLTYKYDGTIGSLAPVNCDLSDAASASITGCNAISNPSYNCDTTTPDASDNCSNDCIVGYNSSFNRTCDQIFSSWSLSDEGIYNLASAGAPPIDTVATQCNKPDPPAPPPPPAPPLVPQTEKCVYLSGGNTIAYQLGEVRADGTKFAGEYNGYCYFTSAADEPGFPTANGTYQWGASGTSISYANSTKDGMFNTANILNRGLADTYAARACKTKCDNNDNGHNDWFLPAYNELLLLHNNKASIGGFSAVRYWISSQEDSTYAYYVNFNGGTYSYQSKVSNSRVRCARKERPMSYVAPNPVNCTDQPGNVCTDGTIYAGSDATYNYFTTAYDEPVGSYPVAYKWGNGGVIIAATSASDGMANTTAILSSADAGIEAAKACKAKNDNSHNGRTDWYLPAPNELIILVNNKSLIGDFSVARYWTSRRHDNTYAYFVSSGDGSSSFYDKLTYYPVRCIRKELKS